MRYLLIALIAFTINFPALAETGKRESVKELMALMEVDSMIETIYSQMNQMFAGVGQQMGIKASEQAVFDNYMEKISALMIEEVSWEKMEEPMIDIYLNNYSEEEIQDMLTFYRSSTGRSLVKKMPAVMGESTKLSQDLLVDFMPKIQTLAAEFAEELKEHREAH